MNSKTLFLLPLLLLLAASALRAQCPSPTHGAAQRRAHIERTTNQVLTERGRTMVVTSRHRDNSQAHQRGAIDIRSNDISRQARHDEARAISERLRNHNVVVEEVRGNRQTNTTYRNGVQGAERNLPRHATGTHTHIQPDRPRCTPTRGATPAR